MIYSLSGVLQEKNTDSIAIDVGGIGFWVAMPSSAVASLPAEGEICTIYTYLNVKEDALDLYGFSDKSMRECFRMLLTVSGVGPKVALGVLSCLSPAQVLLSIAAGDHKAFTKCPGIGPKLAQRMVLELKDRVGRSSEFGEVSAAAGVPASLGDSAQQKAIQALVGLGYTQSEAAVAVSRQPADASVEELVRLSLRALALRK